jgi:peptidyl-prolyl cis-trans isomerase SurA
MKYRAWALSLLTLCAAATSVPLQAQTAAKEAQTADFIVAVVNSEPITNSDVQFAIKRIRMQLEQQRQPAPAPEEMRRMVLERLINDRAQLQWAQETGLRVDEAAIEQAEQAMARQYQTSVTDLHLRLLKEGVNVVTFRKQLRDQITLSRLHEREVESRIRISDLEVERFIQEQQALSADPLAQEINLANLLIAVPEKATPEQSALLFRKAQAVLERARVGADFNTLVQEFSAADKSNGGQIGLRRADRYPEIFLKAITPLAVGGVSEIVRSGAGFHILKMIEKKSPVGYAQFMVQTHARHILLRTGPELSQAAALARLTDVRKRLKEGKLDFATTAREMSQDGSAAQGGDLGWANPGMFVPEFEEAMNQLADGEISNPLVSRFGVHLIMLLERRRVELPPRELRESVRNQLREVRYAEAFATWARDVRGRAFVELREAPL